MTVQRDRQEGRRVFCEQRPDEPQTTRRMDVSRTAAPHRVPRINPRERSGLRHRGKRLVHRGGSRLPSNSCHPSCLQVRQGSIARFHVAHAGESVQVHLATFLSNPGDQSSHVNVWIYNGGASAATAHVEVRRQCDDAVVDDTTVTVGAKGSLAVSGLAADFRGCPFSRFPTAVPLWIPGSIYTIVTVDQPSLSIVSSVANGQIPRAMVSVN